MSKRKVYLEDISLDEARRRFEEALVEAGLDGPFSGERVPVAEALGRVTAAPVWARTSSPHYHASAMDGYAVRAADTSPTTLRCRSFMPGTPQESEAPIHTARASAPQATDFLRAVVRDNRLSISTLRRVIWRGD